MKAILVFISRFLASQVVKGIVKSLRRDPKTWNYTRIPLDDFHISDFKPKAYLLTHASGTFGLTLFETDRVCTSAIINGEGNKPPMTLTGSNNILMCNAIKAYLELPDDDLVETTQSNAEGQTS